MNKSERGFTLIETAIAMIVMMVAGLGAVALFTYAIRVNNISGTRAAAISIAQQTVEQFRGVHFGDVLLTPGTASTTVNGVDSSYTVQTTVCDTSACGGSATLKHIEIVVTPVRIDGLGSSMAVVLSTKRAAPVTGPYLQ
ncbi:MAG TPA: prepilin-type N-terminal cleavage/methylation domain-containing protein [Pyrinomonadaceae bacterium]|nr:prepilin-type N-terminal cleavage/methylation domain-containing protein [Pyrinomonadaceae bacterium]